MLGAIFSSSPLKQPFCTTPTCMCDNTLAKLHPHPRDNSIALNFDDHTYFVTGIDEPLVSVTDLIGRYLPCIDQNVLLDRYYSSLQVSPSKCQHGISKEDIKAIWNVNAKLALDLGSRLHEAIDAFFNGRIPAIDELGVEWAQFCQFLTIYNIVPYRTEFKIYSGASKVAGTIDLLARNEDDSMSLYDWKRSKHSFESGMVLADGVGHAPLDKIPNCQFGRYALQLNVYRAIIEENYNFRVRDMYLVRFHNSIARYEIKHVPRMGEAERLLEHVRFG